MRSERENTMRSELLTKLEEKYPKIFVAGSPACCGDGWYEIIDSLCGVIQNRCNFWNSVVHEDRFPIGHRLHMQTECTSIKYKEDTMRFYYKDGDSFIDGAVRMAEEMSTKAKQ